MNDSAPPIPLNGPQRRHFEVVSAALHAELSALLSAVRGRGSDGAPLDMPGAV